MNNILLIDDNTYILEALALWMGRSQQEWNILTASNGKEGTDIMDSQPVSLVLTDLQMPVMDGYGVIEHTNRKFPNVPIFAMTSDNSSEVKSRLRTLRVTECVEKPFDFEKMTNKIAHALRAEPDATALVAVGCDPPGGQADR